jgi:hypothetical protein
VKFKITKTQEFIIGGYSRANFNGRSARDRYPTEIGWAAPARVAANIHADHPGGRPETGPGSLAGDSQ